VTTLGDIAVLGLGKSGQAAGAYSAQLVRLGEASSVTVLDAADNSALSEAAALLRDQGVRVLLGQENLEGRYDLCIASPGIPPHSPLRRWADQSCARVISELEFAYTRSAVPWLAVTGTNGKTTTTALLAHLLQAGGMRAEAVGNIGFAATDALELADTDIFVAEVSSFQLSLMETFHPKVAVLLNITPDHIDWHGSLEAYAADKARIFENMTSEDTAVIDVDDPGAAPLAAVIAEKGVRVVRVSRSEFRDGGASAVDGVLAVDTAEGPVSLVRASELKIRGTHNVSNALAAAAAALAFGVSPAALREGLRTFEPIAHRLEPAGTVGGVEWFNDSKATNPDAVLKAIHAFEGRPLIVLLGGRNKNNDFAQLAQEVAKIAKAAVLFGEARGELSRAFAGVDLRVAEAITMADAVEVAASVSEPGDVVLLSPACASFDEFTSFEHRGDEFKRLVAKIPGGGS
jgi:UDP-N-acetylmuramoylalanine--D-glutamate ligase